MSDRFSPRFSVSKLVNGSPVLLDVKFKELTYVSTEKKADKCTLTLLNDDLRFPDDATFDCGSTLMVSWGYSGNMSLPREVIVEKWTPGWPDFHVECAGKGILLHKIKDSKSWTKVKRSDVARELAEKWGYGSDLQDIEDTGEVYDTLTKPMMTDAAFLTKMAAREAKKGNAFLFSIDNTGFHFHRERLGAPPVRTFSFIPASNDPGVIKEFPKFDAVSVQNKPGKVTAQGVDLVNGKKVDASASNSTDTGRSTLGTHVIVFDKLGTHTKEERNAAAETTKTTGARSDEEAKKDASASLAKSTGKASKGTLPIIGDPRIFSKDIIRIEKIGKRLSGNYYVYEAHHKVKPGDYTTEIKFRRDANNGGAGTGAPGAADPSTTAGKPNDTKGTDPSGTPTATEPKIVYDKLGGHTKVQFTPTSNKGGS